MMSPRPTAVERLLGRLAHRRPARGDDSGNTLIYALLFTTVIALVIAAVLTLAGANLRTTVAVHTEAVEDAAADGAAKVAINTLRDSTYNGTAGQCLNGSLVLPNFYQSGSTRVDCALDTGASELAHSTGGGFALHALQTGATPSAIYLKLAGAGAGGISVDGDVASTGKTTIVSGQLNITGAFTSASCDVSRTPGNPVIIDRAGAITNDGRLLPPTPPGTPSTVESTTPRCNGNPAPAGDPGYVLPNGAKPDTLGAVTNPNCNGGNNAMQTFAPGLYTSATDLNSFCPIKYFKPGIYWFNFNDLWNIAPNGGRTISVIAGAVNAPNPSTFNPATDIKTACPNPFDASTYDPNAGVTFVFGGKARLEIQDDAQVAICGKPSTITMPDGTPQPPIALYAVKSGKSYVGAQGTVSGAQAGDCTLATLESTGCAQLSTSCSAAAISHQCRMWLYGATYMPDASIALDLHVAQEQHIIGGLVVRQLSLNAPNVNGSSFPNPLSAGPLPGTASGTARTVVYLTVYVCPGASTCATGTGSLRLKAKVAIFDPDAAPASGGHRPITVLSWSVQR
jgi:hypothetical protein